MQAISIEDANGDITKYNGPKEEYLVYLWLLTVATCIALFSNVLGPCSFGRRLHIPGQFGAVCIGGCYLAVSTAISAEWPAEVPFDPHRYFFFAGFCMFSGQCVSTAAASHRRLLLQSNHPVGRPKLAPSGLAPWRCCGG